MTRLFCLSRYFVFTDFLNLYRKIISSFVHPKMKTDFMQAVNLLSVEFNLEWKDQTIITFLTKSLKKFYLSLKLGLKSSSDSQVCRHPVFHDLDLVPFQNSILVVVPGVAISQSSQKRKIEIDKSSCK